MLFYLQAGGACKNLQNGLGEGLPQPGFPCHHAHTGPQPRWVSISKVTRPALTAGCLCVAGSLLRPGTR